jgi:UDP-N-acetylglucosamine 2-epimerase (non-hydrolysing)
MKILTVVGARPQFIKAAVLSPELARRGWSEVLVHSGQHYDYNMSRVFFESLSLHEPSYYLDVGSSSHAVQTGLIMQRLEPILHREVPNWVLIYGDTNTTLAAALATAKLHFPLAHVEAGLRSFDRTMPEEINRIVADHVADAQFAPSAVAVAHLADEGIRQGVRLVGDLMVDLVTEVAKTLPTVPPIIERFELRNGEYGVVTIHRAANTDDEAVFEKILDGLCRANFPIVFPVHPRTKPLATRYLGDLGNSKILVCDPLSYVDMVSLQARARVIITDSGGIQKEAFVLRVPCVTLREATEWPETLVNGWNVLVGCDPAGIAQESRRIRPSEEPEAYYGNGQAAVNIANGLQELSHLHEATAP